MTADDQNKVGGFTNTHRQACVLYERVRDLHPALNLQPGERGDKKDVSQNPRSAPLGSTLNTRTVDRRDEK